jgi:hypothetical protein
LTHAAAGTVVLLDPEQAPYELTASFLDELRGRSVQARTD